MNSEAPESSLVSSGWFVYSYSDVSTEIVFLSRLEWSTLQGSVCE